VAHLVETRSGTVEGAAAAGVIAFKGVPFAASPGGELRFRAPQPRKPWAGRLDCRAYGPISPQNRDPLIDMIPGTANLFFDPSAQQGEDCLSLNIWTSTAEPSTPRPVYLWIHGGAFLGGSGSAPWTDGANLARDEDIVVVSLNYRLGALGGVALGADGANIMTLDQIAALEWIRDNIAAFGGDPDRVTVGGESAGGMSVAALLCAPAARGLFQQAIVESGHAGMTVSLDDTLRAAHEFFAELGIGAGDRGAIAVAPLTEILAAQQRLTGRWAVPFRVVDDGAVIPGDLAGIIAAGRQAPVPLLIGTSSDENNLFAEMGWGPGVPAAGGSFAESLATMFTDADTARLAELTQLYLDAEPHPGRAWRLASTDRDWRIAVRSMADAHAASGHPVYSYEFAYRSPARGGRLGASHALIVPFPFDNLDQPGVGELAGDDPAGAPERRRVSETCRQVWGAFIRAGVPASEHMPEWPRYDATQRAVMTLGPECELVHNPRGARLDRLQAMNPKRAM
jgi:para-nitrobenzyl esterase